MTPGEAGEVVTLVATVCDDEECDTCRRIKDGFGNGTAGDF